MSTTNYNNNNSSKALPSASVGTLAAATTPSKWELPDIPVMMTPNKMATVHSTKSSPVTPQQLGSKLHHHHHLQQQRGSKSEPANVPATTKVLPTTKSSTPSTEIQKQQLPQQQQQQQTQSSVILHHPHHSSNHPRPCPIFILGSLVETLIHNRTLPPLTLLITSKMSLFNFIFILRKLALECGGMWIFLIISIFGQTKIFVFSPQILFLKIPKRHTN
jgi:hypothetical protein